MRATLLGHACWLIESEQGARVLTDPVLSDPFEEGTVTACPARAVDLGALPALTAITISHRHLDHYHLPSLAALPRDLPVYCPDDDLLRYGLAALGFADLRDLEPFGWHDLGHGMRLLAVPSLSDTFVEYAAAYVDDQGVLLNQVDTPLSGENIARLQAALGGRGVDIHLAMHACQDFTFFEGKKQDLAEIHATNLSVAMRVGARVVVPGAAGFRFVDQLGWLNRHLFPISPQRFITDLQRLSPQQHPLSVDPGDVLTLSGGRLSLERQAAPFARMVEDDTHLIAHDPTAPVPALTDDNEGRYELHFLWKFAEGYIGQVMPQLIQQAAQAGDEVVGAYLGLRVAYRVEVVFPDGVERAWTFRLDERPVRLEEGAGAGEPHVRKRIAASALADVCGGRRGCFWMRTRARRSSSVFAMQPTEQGLAVEEVELRDLLTHLIVLSKVAQKGEQRGLLEWYGLLPPEEAPQHASPEGSSG